MYVKTQEGDLVLLFHYRRIFINVSQGLGEIRADDGSLGGMILGIYQNQECAELVMRKIEEAIMNSEKIMCGR